MQTMSGGKSMHHKKIHVKTQLNRKESRTKLPQVADKGPDHIIKMESRTELD